MISKLASSGIFSGFVLIALAALLLQTYEIEDGKVPDLALNLIRLTCIVVLVIGLPIWAFEYGIRPAWRFHKSRLYRWPVIDRERFLAAQRPEWAPQPEMPEAWILPMIDSDRKMFMSLIVPDDAPAIGVWGLLKKNEHYLTLYYWYRNVSVFTVVPDEVTGRVWYEEEQLLSDPPFLDTTHQYFRADGYDHASRFTVAIRIPLTRTLAKLIADRMDSGNPLTLNMEHVSILFRAKQDEGIAPWKHQLAQRTTFDERMLQSAVANSEGRRFSEGRYYIAFDQGEYAQD